MIAHLIVSRFILVKSCNIRRNRDTITWLKISHPPRFVCLQRWRLDNKGRVLQNKSITAIPSYDGSGLGWRRRVCGVVKRIIISLVRSNEVFVFIFIKKGSVFRSSSLFLVICRPTLRPALQRWWCQFSFGHWFSRFTLLCSWSSLTIGRRNDILTSCLSKSLSLPQHVSLSYL